LNRQFTIPIQRDYFSTLAKVLQLLEKAVPRLERFQQLVRSAQLMNMSKNGPYFDRTIQSVISPTLRCAQLRRGSIPCLPFAN
jgi:hypothetical protein